MGTLLVAIAAVCLAGLTVVTGWAKLRLVIVTVEGASMEPKLHTGDHLLVKRCGLERIAVGDVVVLEPPSGYPVMSGTFRLNEHRWHVKRVAALPGDRIPPEIVPIVGVDVVPPGTLIVVGDSPDSVDSRQRGLFHADSLLGVAWRRFR